MPEPIPTPLIDIDDTSRCPVAAECATCGALLDLAVITADTLVGVLCATLCGACAAAGDLPRYSSWGAAIRAVLAHCGHLGVDADEAVAARRSM
jgi:hypothetical protein